MQSKMEFLYMTDVRWDEIVKSFPMYDVYHLSGYVRAFWLHGDGEPYLFYFEKDNFRAINVIVRRDIAEMPIFKDRFPANTYYDVVTPYGYGGFLVDGDTSEENIKELYECYLDFLKEQQVVADFTRYHPLLKNADVLKGYFNVIEVGPTISMDLSSKDIIYNNLERNNRNKIRKAQKNGVIIKHGHESGLWDYFIPIYETTMDKDNATSYYYFQKEFFLSIEKDLKDNYEMFYALYEDKIIAMAIILYGNGKMHYHLSGSYPEYRNLAPTNLLLYEAACWGCELGLKEFHLGGGVGAGDDSLYKFKEGFNRHSSNMFAIGKQVINDEIYQMLIDYREANDSAFCKSSNYFPLYRS